jgi:hypothetical protein
MRFVYAHWFASSPQSRKAQAFRRAFAGRGIALEMSAMDDGDFKHLTISGQLAVLEREIRSEPVCLMGPEHGRARRGSCCLPAFGFGSGRHVHHPLDNIGAIGCADRCGVGKNTCQPGHPLTCPACLRAFTVNRGNSSSMNLRWFSFSPGNFGIFAGKDVAESRILDSARPL